MQTKAAEQLISENGRRSIDALLKPLLHAAGVKAELLRPFEVRGEKYFLPRFSFRGPNSADPIRIGIFAAIHGDEPAGALATVQFLLDLVAEPALAEDYQIHAYPICNPTGFEDNTRCSRNGRDLNREFWKDSSEIEVQIMENELRTQHFHGLIQLHADDTSDGIYGFVRGATLTENLLRPALREAGKILPRNNSALIDGFAAKDGMIYDVYEGVLAAPKEVEPVPFEIIFETPHSAPIDLQVAALQAAMRTILKEYRAMISFAQNI
ncbi:MAG: succinylglutamate desuccinylase/aspartoacylase family protein [Verrucomicrobiota bacterium]